MNSSQKTSTQLNRLSARYCSDTNEVHGTQFFRAFNRYLNANRESLFDVILTASSAHIAMDGDITDVPPLLLEAIKITNPSLSEDNIFSLSEEEIQGAVNTAKGKYFEYLVADRLNAGEQVGSVVLPDGYSAVLADSLNQPGWDMRIVGPDGVTSEYLQLKATDSVGYIQEALNRYPDIEILATTEVAHSGLVIDSGISEEELRIQVANAIDDVDSSCYEQFVDYFSPLFPLIAIALFEGYRVSIGSQTMDDFKLSMARRGQRVIATNIVGAGVYALGGGLMAVPAAILGGMLFDRYWNQCAIIDSYSRCNDRLLSMRLAQQDRLLQGAI
jgi:hypothetical protein